MDIYRIKRSRGQQATGAGAYRAGETIRGERTGDLHNHSGRRDVRHTALIKDKRGDGSHGVGAAQTFRPTLRSVLFYSSYIYSPRGASYSCEFSRQLCLRLKLGDPAYLAFCAAQVRELAIRDERFARLFARPVLLVPAPGSSASGANGAGALWAAERLAFALHGIGLGESIWTGVRRILPVRKSATALNGSRPGVRQHYESLAVTALHFATVPSRIVVIDDVITKGRTLFAASLRLQEAFPNADIRAFALVRTMGFLPSLSHCLDPCQGVIRWAGNDTRREP